MGQLRTLQTLSDLTWYLADAVYSPSNRTWDYSWPNASFPHLVAIHGDNLAEYRDRKVAIRRWIELHISGTVITGKVDKSYRVYFFSERTWDNSYKQENDWVTFHFESAEDALAFRIAFSEYVQDITDLHPTQGHVYEKTSYYKTY